MGIEPTSQPWEGRILPMKYTRGLYILYQNKNQKSRVLQKKYEGAKIHIFRALIFTKYDKITEQKNRICITEYPHRVSVLQSNGAENRTE